MTLIKGLPVELTRGELVIVNQDYGESFTDTAGYIYPKTKIQRIYKRYGKNLISKEVKSGNK